MRILKKQEIVGELKDKFERSKVVIATNYVGLNVAQMNALRRKLRETGSEYHVVKNTLLHRAAEGNTVESLKGYFKGNTAIALHFSDPVAPAKVLIDFIKENEKLVIKAGSLGGKLVSADGIKALADLPSRDVLLGQLLSVMNGVPTSLVRVLSGVPQKLLNVLTAIKDQRQSAES
uniref:Large ribosomal subunit protein uL10 n=1 Tax=Desulfatirhabdium butyrativorans TaxID=340467 RepID=A0A7C4W818_9BACT